MFGATTAAFVAASIYAGIAQKTLQEVHIQTVAEQRALIVVEGSPIYGTNEQIVIPYVNRGHVAASLESVEIAYERGINGKTLKISGVPTNMGHPKIAVGQPYSAIIIMPKVPIRPVAGDFVRLETTVRYDDGFGSIEPSYSCFSMELISKVKIWSNCGRGTIIDLSKGQHFEAERK